MMVPAGKLLDAYAVFLWCHTAAESPAIPGLGSMTILPRCSINAKVSMSFRPRQQLLSCIVAHEQPSLRALPAYVRYQHLPTRPSVTGLESIHHQSLLLEVLHHQKQESWR